MKNQEIVVLDISDDVKTDAPPPKKKLKQARLPFQVITTADLSSDTRTASSSIAKKRRMSDIADDSTDIKVVKNDNTESKENVNSSKTCQADENKLVTEYVFSPIREECQNEKEIEVLDETNEHSTNPQLNSCITVKSAETVAPVTPQKVETAETDEILVGDEPDVIKCSISSDDSDSPDTAEKDVTVKANDNVSKRRSSNRSSSKLETPDQTSKTSQNGKTPNRNLTPQQLKKQEDREKVRQEKLKQKQDKDDQRKREKEEKEEVKRKEKEAKEELKKKEREEKEELKKKEKDEKEDQRKKEKEERENKRQAELELKNEEKRLKEEEKHLREIAEEEARSKKNKKITSFFSSKAKKPEPMVAEQSIAEVVVEKNNFHPFQVKSDMRLAPLVRIKFTDHQPLELAMKKQCSPAIYLSQLKERSITTCGKTWPLSEYKDEVMIIESENKILDTSTNMFVLTDSNKPNQLKAKLILFHENRRPPFWGTWRKKSQCIRPTFPFAKDTALFDYEVDSDDEWEEEEPGESLHGSDDEKESVDDYEIDNDFFVPHGYLSDEENEGQEEEVMTPETQKAKLKFLEVEFDKEMKHKTERIKPRLIGCIWTDQHTNIVGTQLMKMLTSRRALIDGPIKLTPLSETALAGNILCSLDEAGTSLNNKPVLKKVKLTEDTIRTLLQLMHGNTNSRTFLIKEFTAYLKKSLCKQEVTEDKQPIVSTPDIVVSQQSISNKIKDLANWMPCLDEGPMGGRMCWYVSEEVRSSFGLADLTIPNSWQYTLLPRRNKDATSEASSAKSSPHTPKAGPSNLITNFTKIVTPEELHKQFSQAGNNRSGVNTLTTPTLKKSLITNFTKVITPEERAQKINHSKVLLATSKLQQTPTMFQAVLKGGPSPVEKKRAKILFSVARGQEIPSSSSAKPMEDCAKIDTSKLDKSIEKCSPDIDKKPDCEKMDVECIDIDD